MGCNGSKGTGGSASPETAVAQPAQATDGYEAALGSTDKSRLSVDNQQQDLKPEDVDAAGDTCEAEDTAQPAAVGQDAEEQRMLEATPLEEYCITLEFSKDAKLGANMVVLEANGGMRLGELKDGLLMNWNDQNPHQLVRAGDIIIEVNGATGAQGIAAELNSSKDLRIRLRREPVRCHAPDDIVSRQTAADGVAGAGSTGESSRCNKTGSSGAAALAGIGTTSRSCSRRGQSVQEEAPEPDTKEIDAAFDVRETSALKRDACWCQCG